MLYMFLLHWNEKEPAVSGDAVLAEHFAFTDEVRKRGAYVYSESIGGTAGATTVRVREGKTILTDGPYAETKEVMGGFYILDCRDLDEALEYAAQIPDAKYAAVEVRPVMHVPGGTMAPPPTANVKRSGEVPSKPHPTRGTRLSAYFAKSPAAYSRR